jgi:quinol monooxygenase YgiN
VGYTVQAISVTGSVGQPPPRVRRISWRNTPMSVYSIWDFHYPADTSARGLSVAQAIWADMRAYDGYLGHELVSDLDDPGHIMVVSRWSSRDHADAVLVAYADNPNAREATSAPVQQHMPVETSTRWQFSVGASSDNSPSASRPR